jgi:hypothetical protein
MIYDPLLIKNKVLRKWFVTDLSPFPWIKIPDNRKQEGVTTPGQHQK